MTSRRMLHGLGQNLNQANNQQHQQYQEESPLRSSTPNDHNGQQSQPLCCAQMRCENKLLRRALRKEREQRQFIGQAYKELLRSYETLFDLKNALDLPSPAISLSSTDDSPQFLFGPQQVQQPPVVVPPPRPPAPHNQQAIAMRSNAGRPSNSVEQMQQLVPTSSSIDQVVGRQPVAVEQHAQNGDDGRRKSTSTAKSTGTRTVHRHTAEELERMRAALRAGNGSQMQGVDFSRTYVKSVGSSQQQDQNIIRPKANGIQIQPQPPRPPLRDHHNIVDQSVQPDQNGDGRRKANLAAVNFKRRERLLGTRRRRPGYFSPRPAPLLGEYLNLNQNGIILMKQKVPTKAKPNGRQVQAVQPDHQVRAVHPNLDDSSDEEQNEEADEELVRTLARNRGPNGRQWANWYFVPFNKNNNTDENSAPPRGNGLENASCQTAKELKAERHLRTLLTRSRARLRAIADASRQRAQIASNRRAVATDLLKGKRQLDEEALSVLHADSSRVSAFPPGFMRRMRDASKRTFHKSPIRQQQEEERSRRLERATNRLLAHSSAAISRILAKTHLHHHSHNSTDNSSGSSSK